MWILSYLPWYRDFFALWPKTSRLRLDPSVSERSALSRPWFLSANGQPDKQWCAVKRPVTWPEPSHPGVGHFLFYKQQVWSQIWSNLFSINCSSTARQFNQKTKDTLKMSVFLKFALYTKGTWKNDLWWKLYLEVLRGWGRLLQDMEKLGCRAVRFSLGPKRHILLWIDRVFGTWAYKSQMKEEWDWSGGILPGFWAAGWQGGGLSGCPVLSHQPAGWTSGWSESIHSSYKWLQPSKWI